MHALYRISQYLFNKLKDVKKLLIISCEEDMERKFENLICNMLNMFGTFLKLHNVLVKRNVISSVGNLVYKLPQGAD